jgi:hypothetical protein
MNRPDRIEGRHGRRLHVRLVLNAVMAIGFAACTVAGESPSAGPDASASDSVARKTPTATIAPTEGQPLAASTLVSESAAPTTNLLSCAGPHSSGRWTGINWTTAKNHPAAKPSAADGTEATFGLFGWSKGYLAFRPDPVAEGAAAQTIEIDASTDGLNWSVVETLTITPSTGLDLPVSIGRVVEGPAGLLALGNWAAPRADFPATRPVEVILRSTDGRHWTYASASAVLGSANVNTVDARGVGYIATGASSDFHEAIVWVSSDGSTWRRSQLPGPGVDPRDAKAFGGGYALLAAVYGGDASGEGTVTPSLWWSRDGLSWDQASVPGIRSGGTLFGETETGVARINDHALLAMEYTYDDATQSSTQTAWVSTDGKTWCPDAAARDVWPGQIVSDGDRSIWIRPATDDLSPTAFWAFEDDFSLVELVQTGTVPTGQIARTALGPAGLLVTDYSGTLLYLGVPSS